jgi:hypothetical protein
MSARAVAVPGRHRHARGLLAGVLALALLVTVAPAPAGAEEVSLAAFYNNVGITQDPGSGANFDGVGWSYSSIALLAEGVRGGENVAAQGMSFTWPETASGEPDNMAMNGQFVPLLPPAGATTIGLLGAATNGPVTTAVTLHYNVVDADGELQQVAVTEPVTFSDWTLNAGSASPHPSNTIAIEMLFRWPINQSTSQDEPHVFVTTIPIDPTMTLDSIEFPVESRMHLFGMAVQ